MCSRESWAQAELRSQGHSAVRAPSLDATGARRSILGTLPSLFTHPPPGTPPPHRAPHVTSTAALRGSPGTHVHPFATWVENIQLGRVMPAAFPNWSGPLARPPAPWESRSARQELGLSVFLTSAVPGVRRAQGFPL